MTVSSARPPVRPLPPDTIFHNHDETPLPHFGKTSGPEYEALIWNLGMLCCAEQHHQREQLVLLAKNPALQVLEINKDLFPILCKAFATGGMDAMKAKFDIYWNRLADGKAGVAGL